MTDDLEKSNERDDEKIKNRLSYKFKKRREDISNEIYKNAEKLIDLRNLKQVQVNMLSLRQRLLEDTHSLLDNISILRKKLREEKAKELENISKNFQIRYQTAEKNIAIEAKTSNLRETLDIFENQIQFFNESIKTIDSIIFAIKTRLDIEKTLGL